MFLVTQLCVMCTIRIRSFGLTTTYVTVGHAAQSRCLVLLSLEAERGVKLRMYLGAQKAQDHASGDLIRNSCNDQEGRLLPEKPKVVFAHQVFI